MRRRIIGSVVAALVAATTAPTALAPPASAAAYRYWSYWQVDDKQWQWARIGPTGARPDDGGVQGWRFAVTVDSSSAVKPRTNPSTTFASVCGSTPPQSGKKRIALVIDFGVAADARPGDTVPGSPLRSECVVVGASASGWDVLVATGISIRTDDSSMICAFAGYPSAGCGEQVDDPGPRPDPTSSGPGSGSGGGSPGRGGSGSSSGSSGSDGRDETPATNGGKPSTKATARPDATAGATGTASPTSTPSGTASPVVDSASSDASAEPTPTLVDGLPAADDSASGGPLALVVGLLVVAGIAAAAVVRTRRAGQRR